MVKITHAELVGKKIRITIEEKGREFIFVGDTWELLDKDHLRQVLRNWRDRIIPRKLWVERLSREELERRVRALEGMEV